MLETLKFHHLGIATTNFEKAKKTYLSFGYKVLIDCVEIPLQKVNVCFLEKSNHPLIELIEPLSHDSPVANILKKYGSGPYHTCYSTTNINLTINDLRKKKFIQISPLEKSKAFENNLICFVYKDDIGLIEILELKV